MRKMLLFLLAGTLLLFSGCDFLEGPAGADGMLETNLVTGSFKVPENIYLNQTGMTWVVTLDDDLDSSNGVISVDTGAVIQGFREYQFEFYNVPPGDYYLFVVAETDSDGAVNSIFDKNESTVASLAYIPEAFAFFGVFTDTEVSGFTGTEDLVIHPSIPNVTVPESGWLSLQSFLLIQIVG